MKILNRDQDYIYLETDLPLQIGGLISFNIDEYEGIVTNVVEENSDLSLPTTKIYRVYVENNSNILPNVAAPLVEWYPQILSSRLLIPEIFFYTSLSSFDDLEFYKSNYKAILDLDIILTNSLDRLGGQITWQLSYKFNDGYHLILVGSDYLLAQKCFFQTIGKWQEGDYHLLIKLHSQPGNHFISSTEVNWTLNSREHQLTLEYSDKRNSIITL